MSFIPLRLFLCLLWASFVPFVANVFAADGTYTNPIIDADYSDPDVIRVGDDFYLTASSFNCVPGLPILHSKDVFAARAADERRLQRTEVRSAMAVARQPTRRMVFLHAPRLFEIKLNSVNSKPLDCAQPPDAKTAITTVHRDDVD